MSIGATAGAAAARRAERRLVGHLREAGAVTSDSACSIPDQRWMGNRVLSRLIRAGAIHEVKTGYYLDEEVYLAYHARRHRVAFTIIGTLVGILVVVASLFIIWASQRG